uniref:Uncharacterized protein n=1 Tax=Zea mays TaxID=4577 RepID=B6SNH8_MAIZE|nr:hypothetical protein [Zea mays]
MARDATEIRDRASSGEGRAEVAGEGRQTPLCFSIAAGAPSMLLLDRSIRRLGS